MIELLDRLASVIARRHDVQLAPSCSLLYPPIDLALETRLGTNLRCSVPDGEPMKGMLTGPVTILQWSFVRDDQPRAETCRQIALTIRDDLKAAGARIIQVDEAAPGEGLPLRRADRQTYLDWVIESFEALRPATCRKRRITRICAMLIKAGKRLSARQLWLNLDCGPKTRKWEDVKPAPVSMVEAAKAVRARLA